MPYKDPQKRKEHAAKYGKLWYQKNKTRLKHVRAIWRKNNKKKCVEYQINWRKNNPEKYQLILQKRKPKTLLYLKDYYQKNKKNILQKKYRRLQEDSDFRLKELVRSRIQSGLKQNTKNLIKKNGKSVMYLGCSFKEYKSYLEEKFKPGMTWSNMGKNGWEIDHIVPLASFNFSKKNNLMKAFHYTNTQPLWSIENKVKGDREERRNYA